MMKIGNILAVILIAALAPAYASAQGYPPPAPPSHDNGSTLRFQVGVSYINGVSELTDAYEDMGYEKDFEWPFGLNFMLRQDFSTGFGWDINVGPFVCVSFDNDNGDDWDDDHGDDHGDYDYLMPVGADIRYTFMASAQNSPYVRAGVCALACSSDYFDSNGLGFEGAVGMEFMRDSFVSYGVEAGYNSVSVEFDNGEDVTPFGFTLSFFAAF